MLVLVLRGEVDVTQDERATKARSGDLVLYDQTRPFRSHSVLLRIAGLFSSTSPARSWSRDCQSVDMTSQRIAGSSALGGLMGSIIQQIASFSEMANGNVINRVATSALDVIATTMESELTDFSKPNAAKIAYSGRPNYTCWPTFTCKTRAERIAKSQSISARTLCRLFASEGTTPIRWLCNNASTPATRHSPKDTFVNYRRCNDIRFF